MLFLKELAAGHSNVTECNLFLNLYWIFVVSLAVVSARQKIMSNLMLFLALGHVSHLPLEAAILP